jgi:cytochrome c biogenesis protein CcmG/thiol:disulfide interchange protein DsbE
MEAAATPSRRWSRLVIFLLPALAFVALLVIAVLRVNGPPEIGDPAPPFSAPYLSEEGSLALSDLQGKPVVLNFWASWCGPCKDEAPMLRKAVQRYGDRVQIVGVNAKDARSDALAFVSDEQLGELTHIRDETGEMYDNYGLTGQPETFFIDSDGEIVEHVNGPLFEDTLFSLLDVLVQRDG